MTICIAGICDSGRSIVAVSDRKRSKESYSNDMMGIKIRDLTKDWAVMLASDNASEIPPIIEAVKAELGGGTCSCVRVAEVFTEVLQEHINTCATNSVLVPFGISMSDFLKEGRRIFTDQEHEKIVSKISNLRINSDFLVFGFDGDGRSHILVISDQGQGGFEIGNYDSLAMIGSGCFMAESILFFHGYRDVDDVYEAIYLLCHAKFMAESADGVGRSTMVLLKQLGKEPLLLRAEDIEVIRDFWERKGKPRIPESAYAMVRNVIHKAEAR
jgi:hypothetical protein